MKPRPYTQAQIRAMLANASQWLPQLRDEAKRRGFGTSVTPVADVLAYLRGAVAPEDWTPPEEE